MKFGIPPFYQKEKNYPLLFKKIKEKEVNFGNTIQLSDQMKDIIKKVTFIFALGVSNNLCNLKLLIKDPNKRLGSQGVSEIKKHAWFADIDWLLLGEKKV